MLEARYGSVSKDRMPIVWARISSHFEEMWKLPLGVESDMPFLRQKGDMALLQEAARLTGINRGRPVQAIPPIHLDHMPIGLSPFGIKDRGYSHPAVKAERTFRTRYLVRGMADQLELRDLPPFNGHRLYPIVHPLEWTSPCRFGDGLGV